MKPIATTTSLSLLFHAAVVMTLLSVSDHMVIEQAVGTGISIELISSTEADDAIETERAKKQVLAAQQSSRLATREMHRQTDNDSAEQVDRSEAVLHTAESERSTAEPGRMSERMLKTAEIAEVTDTGEVTDTARDDADALLRSTDASQQLHTILELLHSSISDNKVYPYLARRQRREGVSTVAFILYPDGRVEQAQLVNSSQTASLDRAAISAVKDIEPFHAAQKYLDQEERFQVDVVFSLL